MGIGKSSRTDFVYLCVVSEFFDILSNKISFQWVFFTKMLPWPHMLKQDLARFIRGNKVFLCKMPMMAVVMISLHVQST